jgi:hypothetical protein
LACGISSELDGPEELLGWVVEPELILAGSVGDRFFTSELKLFNQIFVTNLGESASLFTIEINVINEKSGILDISTNSALSEITRSNNELIEVSELEVKSDLVVLKGNQRKSQTVVSVEPELEWNVESVLVLNKASLIWGLEIAQLWYITDHLGVTSLEITISRKLPPDVQPVTVLLIDSGTSNFKLGRVNQSMTQSLNPCELAVLAFADLGYRWCRDRGQSHSQIHLCDQVTVSCDATGNLSSKIRLSIEGMFNNLHGEVGVSSVM